MEAIRPLPLAFQNGVTWTVRGRHFRVRRAGAVDREAIVRFISCQRDDYGIVTDPSLGARSIDYDLAALEKIYRGSNGVFWLVFDDQSELVATAAFARLDGRCCELRKLYLSPKVRGLGLGRVLVGQLIIKARACGYLRMMLKTHSSMLAANSLYQKMGFIQLPRWPYPSASTATLFYEYKLQEAPFTVLAVTRYAQALLQGCLAELLAITEFFKQFQHTTLT